MKNDLLQCEVTYWEVCSWLRHKHHQIRHTLSLCSRSVHHGWRYSGCISALMLENERNVNIWIFKSVKKEFQVWGADSPQLMQTMRRRTASWMAFILDDFCTMYHLNGQRHENKHDPYLSLNLQKSRSDPLNVSPQTHDIQKESWGSVRHSPACVFWIWKLCWLWSIRALIL